MRSTRIKSRVIRQWIQGGGVGRETHLITPFSVSCQPRHQTSPASRIITVCSMDPLSCPTVAVLQSLRIPKLSLWPRHTQAAPHLCCILLSMTSFLIVSFLHPACRHGSPSPPHLIPPPSTSRPAHLCCTLLLSTHPPTHPPTQPPTHPPTHTAPPFPSHTPEVPHSLIHS